MYIYIIIGPRTSAPIDGDVVGYHCVASGMTKLSIDYGLVGWYDCVSVVPMHRTSHEVTMFACVVAIPCILAFPFLLHLQVLSHQSSSFHLHCHPE